ncbi:MAG: inorganic phosphate transporter [Candidatus Marinimicrobia bacterium]|nr:inorganic phosphate transporter [Candidatus Neomarinimicrobiota bacterium]
MSVYLLMVIILFFLAVSGLVVGVTNDAVNFLNSARGAKAAKNWIILSIASLGILLGTTFSSGMMEVARKGIFHPEQFSFSEIMVIYLAVMLTNVILLDVYNTLALPTSTTVSVVFSLMGAALAVSLIKIGRMPAGNLSDLSEFINSEKAMAIIAGILISVLIAFAAGSLVQFVTRLIFTFKYQKGLSRYGAIWGGLCIAVITYFILVKGADGASFMTPEVKTYIAGHAWEIFGISFLGWTVLIQLLRWTVRVNIPRMIILIGTFSLAFAFAGNDLVNFIGVPLAGFKAFTVFSAASGADPHTFPMNFMTGTMRTETGLLLIAGMVMVITLWVSKKSRHVSQTELSIARQDIGEERFSSTGLSRAVVHAIVNVNEFFRGIVPGGVRRSVEKRFSRPVINPEDEARSFDLIRASMNLTIASCLIALGTSFELPLSTTYVTFMVSMGTSLADRAWGRESAVYRISGVFTVIGGWFLTAIIALTVSMIFAFVIRWGGIVATFLLFAFSLFVLYRTFVSHRNSEKEKEAGKEDESNDIYTMCNQHTVKILSHIPELFEKTIEAAYQEDRKNIKALLEESNELMLDTKSRKNCFTVRLRNLEEDSLEYGHFYLQMLHYIREFSHTINYVVGAAYEHIYNKHRGIINEQYLELQSLCTEMNGIFDQVASSVERQEYHDKEKIKRTQEKLLDRISECQSNQIRRVKHGETNTRNTLLYMSLLFGIRDLLSHVIRLLKVQSKFAPRTDGSATPEQGVREKKSGQIDVFADMFR